MHGREHFHRLFARIDAEKLFVNLQNSLEFAVQRLARDVRHVQIHRRLPANPQFLLIYNAVNRARGDVARHQISVLRIPLFQKIKSLCFRNALRRALLCWIPRHPNAPALSARRLAHQTQLVFSGNRRRMHLDEFTVGVVDALLKQRGLR